MLSAKTSADKQQKLTTTLLLPDNNKLWPTTTQRRADDVTHDVPSGEEAWSKVDLNVRVGRLSGNAAANMTAV